jgi:hypothetical protein
MYPQAIEQKKSKDANTRPNMNSSALTHSGSYLAACIT